MRPRRFFFLAAPAVALALVAARAEDAPRDGTLADALAALANVDSALATWSRSEPTDSEVRRAAREGPFIAQDAIGGDAARGLAADATAQPLLQIAETRLLDIEAKIARREDELIYGAAAPPPVETIIEPSEERFDLRALARTNTPSSLPFVGIPLPGAATSDDRLRPEEVGCEAERVPELIDVSDEGGAMLDVIDGTLFVRATPITLARVRATVEPLLAMSARRLVVELRAYRLDRALRAELARLGGEDGALSDEGEKKLAELPVVAETTLVAGDGRVARAFRGEARSFLAEIAGTGSGAMDSASRTVHTGFFAEAVPRLEEDGRPDGHRRARTVCVSLRTALVTAAPSTRSRFQGTELELPEIALARTATTARLPLGRTALVGGVFESAETPAACAIALRVTLLAPPPAPSHRAAGTPRSKQGARGLFSLDKEAKAEIARLDALLPVVRSALEKVRAAKEKHVAVIDVRDLLVRDTGALSLPRLGLVGAGAVDEEPTPTGIEPERLDAVIKRATGGDEAWAQAALVVGHGALLVRQTPGTIEQIVGLLDSLRRERRGRIEVEAGLYRVAAASVLSGPLTKEALGALDAAAARGDATLVAGGFVAARTGERVSVFAGRERAFLAGSSGLPAGGSIPTLSVARTGFRLAVRARLERGAVVLDADASSAALRAVTNAESPGAVLNEPALELDSSTQEVILEPGGGFALVRSRVQGGALMLVLRARPL